MTNSTPDLKPQESIGLLVEYIDLGAEPFASTAPPPVMDRVQAQMNNVSISSLSLGHEPVSG